MATVYDLPSSDFDAVEVEVRHPKGIKLERPIEVPLNSAATATNPIGLVLIPYDRLFHAISVEDPTLFGWYLESSSNLDVSQPLTILEALGHIARDDGDVMEAIQLCLQVWLTTFFRTIKKHQDNVGDLSVPTDTIRRESQDVRSETKDLADLVAALGYDIEDTTPFWNDLTSGELKIDPDRLRDDTH